MMRAMLLIATVLLRAGSASGQEMTFELVGSGGNCAGCEWIRAEGRIMPETPDRFREFGTIYPGIVVGLHSSGGDLTAGLELGRLFREYEVTTRVFRSLPSRDDPTHAHDIMSAGARCESACAYAFLGGLRRSVDSEAALGFHQFSDQSAISIEERSISEIRLLIESARDQYVTGLIVDYLIEMDIDIRLYPIVAAVEPEMDIRLLTNEEISELNVDNSQDVLGEWDVYPMGNGLFVEARSTLTERRVRLFCGAMGTHYFNVVLSRLSHYTAETLRETYRVQANNQIGLLVDGQSIVTRVAEVSELSPSGEVMISLAVEPSHAYRIARARQISYDYDYFFPPTFARGYFWQPFDFNRITGSPDFPLNAFRLCV